MFERVNPCHPDKVAKRIADALVNLSYQKEADLRIARNLAVDYVEAPQHVHFAKTPADGVCCGDSGIFKRMPVIEE